MSWQNCKNILCIRPDNMGDLIMTIPAIRALKETFGARITVLTSSMAKAIVNHIPEIDDAIIYDLPWVKTAETPDVDGMSRVVSLIKERQFDAAVIFTVYSQNPLPTAMLAYMAGIPKTLAYCRENPYHLLTDWVPDKEPYTNIKHQVQRDLDLVASVGAVTTDRHLRITCDDNKCLAVAQKLAAEGVNIKSPWLILHAGVSEKKREYPVKRWIEVGKTLVDMGYQLILTGSAGERGMTDELQQQIGESTFSAAGWFNLDEFICLVKHAPVMLSVNTGTIHIAAALATPVVVLYAQTNPQHTPWMVPAKVLPFAVPMHLRSRNEVIMHVNKTVYTQPTAMPTPNEVVAAVQDFVSLRCSTVQPFRGILSENPEIAAS